MNYDYSYYSDASVQSSTYADYSFEDNSYVDKSYVGEVSTSNNQYDYLTK